MRNSRYALLGILTRSPMSGYDLKKFIEISISHFWHESYGNLYPRLRQLEGEGLVKARRQKRPNGPDAFVYSITRRGRAEFRAWMAQPASAEPVRNELLLKIFFADTVPLKTSITQLRRYREREKALLATLTDIERMLIREAADKPQFPFWHITLRRGLTIVKARLRWTEESLATLAALAKRRTPGTGKRRILKPSTGGRRARQ